MGAIAAAGMVEGDGWRGAKKGLGGHGRASVGMDEGPLAFAGTRHL